MELENAPHGQARSNEERNGRVHDVPRMQTKGIDKAMSREPIFS